MEFASPLSKSDIKQNTLENPANKSTIRQFFDINAVLVMKPEVIAISNLSREIRVSQFDKEHIRVVLLLDKKDKIDYKLDGKLFIISSSSKKPLINETQDKSPKKESSNILNELNLELEKNSSAITSTNMAIDDKLPIKSKERLERKKLIVLDPGHGGKDSGAIGVSSRMEKNIVLNMAIITKAILEKRGYEVVLTRDADYFVELQDRTRFANSKGADLFISIHANAVDLKHSDPGKAKGVETFFLSPARSDRAKRAAEKENGANMDMMDDLSRGTFLNVLNRDKIVASNKLAIDIHRFVLGNVRSKFNQAVDGGVREAPFWVLVGAQMPAILLEIGYITNPDEAERFDSPIFKALLAKGVADGVDSYFDNN